MIIKIKKSSDVPSSEVTSESEYLNRRSFLAASATAIGATAGAAALLGRAASPLSAAGSTPASASAVQELEPTAEKLITSYNNFYEFGLAKEDPAKHAHALVTEPWSVVVDGLCNNPAEYQLEEFVSPSTIEDRVYRFRCVEAWSMVVPWQGFPLADVIKRADPTGDAEYVAFETLWDPDQMPQGRWRNWEPRIGWPYREGLRLDEAMHPLAFLATGLYGKDMPNQNGAPLRLVVPWKYGFKSIKSIVRMTFTAEEPPTTWATQASNEYGFYSNVNPDVSHPRWSQARERPLGSFRRVPTRFLNGYADEVAHLYEGMDLKKHY